MINNKSRTDHHKRISTEEALAVTLANTGEVLRLKNRSGNRPGRKSAAEQLDKSIALCRKASFRKIAKRGDTDFSQAAYLDGWHEQGDFLSFSATTAAPRRRSWLMTCLTAVEVTGFSATHERRVVEIEFTELFGVCFIVLNLVAKSDGDVFQERRDRKNGYQPRQATWL